jgi:hypothetical protein
MPRIGDVEDLNGWPWQSFGANISCFSLDCKDEQQSNTYPFDHKEHTHSWVTLSVWVQVCIDHIRINICCCIVVMIARERPSNIVLIVATLHGSFLAFSPWYCSNPFQELNRQLDTMSDNQETNYDTLIAVKWIVWGMHRMRASCAENEIPRCWHHSSSDVINMLLLLALSIMIAMICECISKIHWWIMGNIPFRWGHIVPLFAKQPLPYSCLNAPR